MKGVSSALGVVAILAASLLPASCSFAGGAEAPRGVIDLVVVTAEEQPLPGVAVTLQRTDEPGESAPVTELTPASGKVRFAGLDQGTYSVRLELSGFFTTTLSDIPIELERPSPRLPQEIRVVLPAGPIWI